MHYDVINPSDAITFEAPDRQVATFVLALIGSGQYSGEAYDGDGKRQEAQDVPFFMFGGFEEFWKGNWPGQVEADAFQARKADTIAALRSVTLGSLTDRKMYDSACAAITDPDKLKAFQGEWNDKKRSSMNDIMGRAHTIANKLAGVPEPGNESKAKAPVSVLVQ